MKRYFALSAIALACSLGIARSQAPASATATPANTRRMLETIRETNAKLLEQQAKTLQLLEEMEKTSQTLKTLGKRA
jgi:hypothetical protein